MKTPRDLFLTALVVFIGAGIALGVEWFSPRLDGDVTRVMLLQPPATPKIPALPDRTVSALQTERNFASGYHDPTGPFPVAFESLRFEFEVPETGHYVLGGVSANAISQPLELSINRRPISAVAYFENTDNVPAESHLAGNVHLTEGPNTVALVGPNIMKRPFALDLQRRKPMSFWRALGLFALAMVPLLALRAALVRFTGSPRARLIATCAVTTAIPVGLLVAAWQWQGPELVRLGYKHPELQRRVQTFDRYLESRDTGSDPFSIAIFGDSTHYLKLRETQQIIPTLQRALDARELDCEVFGVSAGGMAAWEYYLWANRVIAEQPDLLVLPINGSAFSPGWMGNRGYWLPELERYLRAGELPWALNAAAAGRRFDVKRLLFQHLDDALFDGDLGPLLRGLRLYEEEERKRVATSFLRFGQTTLPPIPAGDVEIAEDDSEWGLVDVGPDHEWFPFFGRISRLAHTNGIDVLYYNVLEQPLNTGGIGPVTAGRDIDAILETLGKAPGVHVLRLPEDVPERMFSDRWIHLTPAGMEMLVARLADEIEAIYRESQP